MARDSYFHFSDEAFHIHPLILSHFSTIFTNLFDIYKKFASPIYVYEKKTEK